MEANPEVMPAAVAPTTRQLSMPGLRNARGDASPAAKNSAAVSARPDPRLSEDPMRRTDRYRLVMPYSARM
jgi:hypothetical protein